MGRNTEHMGVTTAFSSSTVGQVFRGTRVTQGTLLFVVLLATGGLFIRLADIANRSLWVDEGVSLEAAAADSLLQLLRNLANSTGSERFQPLYFVFLHYWRAFFGESDVALRLPSVFFSLATILIVARTSSVLFDNRRAAMSAVIVTTSGFSVFYAQEVRPYSMLVLLTSVVLWSWATGNAPESMHRKRVNIRFVLASSALCCGSIFAVVPLSALAIADAITRRDRRLWKEMWIPAATASIAVGIIVYLPTIVIGNATPVPHRENFIFNVLFVLYGIFVGVTYGPPLEALHGTAKLAEVVLSFWPRLTLLVVTSGALVYGLKASLVHTRFSSSQNNSPANAIVLAFIISLAEGALMAYLMDFNWLPRHAYYLFPLLALLMPLAVYDWRLNNPVVIALAAAISFNVLSVCNYLFVPAHRQDDYIAAARYVNELSRRHVSVVLLFGNMILLRDHYNAEAIIDGRGLTAENFAGGVLRLTGNATRAALVINRAMYYYLNDQVSVLVSGCYTVSTKVQFSYFDIYELYRNDSCE
jgi:uncharacterized membrane protein